MALLAVAATACRGPAAGVRPPAAGGVSLVYPGGRPPAGHGYAGSPSCRGCHQAAWRSWEATAHSRSLEGLSAAGSGMESSCLRCHATGYGLAGGHADGVEGLDSVGCEACHGPSAGHVREPGDVRTSGGLRKDCPPCVVNEVCRTCHTPARSPGFDPGDYLERSRCP